MFEKKKVTKTWEFWKRTPANRDERSKKKITPEEQENFSKPKSLVWFGLVWLVLRHINLCRLFNAKYIFM